MTKLLASAMPAVASNTLDELYAVQGKAVDISGYDMPAPTKLAAIMRPSATFNAALASVKA